MHSVAFGQVNQIEESIKLFNQGEMANQTCDSLLIDYTINKPRYITSQTSYQIKKNFQRKEDYLLGLHVGERSYALKIEEKQNTGNKKCHHFTLTIVFNADIYIASETLSSQCTYERTREHEYRHFMFEVDEIKKQNQWILNILRENKNIFDIVNPPYTKKYYEQSLLQIEAGFVVRNQKRHAAIDTRENYSREQKSCPMNETQEFIENVSFNRLFGKNK